MATQSSMISGSQPVDDFGWTSVGAVIGAATTGLFAWLAARTGGKSSIEVAVLGEWQKLNGALAGRLAAVEKEFSEYRQKMSADMADLHRKYANEIDEMRKQHRAEMRAIRDLNEGLQRQIAQNSASTAHLMGDAANRKPGE